METNTLEKSIYNDTEFNEILSDILNNNTVQELKKYRQHFETSIFTHSEHVAYYTYKICKKHNLNYIPATKAAMLHDLFLYDWRVKQPNTGILPHGFTHPRIALNNAIKLYELDDMQKDIILKHMWPLTVVPPKYKESFIVTIVDKYSTFKEFFDHIKYKWNKKNK